MLNNGNLTFSKHAYFFFLLQPCQDGQQVSYTNTGVSQTQDSAVDNEPIVMCL